MGAISALQRAGGATHFSPARKGWDSKSPKRPSPGGAADTSFLLFPYSPDGLAHPPASYFFPRYKCSFPECRTLACPERSRTGVSKSAGFDFDFVPSADLGIVLDPQLSTFDRRSAGRLESEIAPGFPHGDACVDRAAGRELGVGVPLSCASEEFFKPVEDSIPHGEPPKIRGQGQTIPWTGARQQGLKHMANGKPLVQTSEGLATRTRHSLALGIEDRFIA